MSRDLEKTLKRVGWVGLLCLLVVALLHVKVTLKNERLYRPYLYTNAYDLPGNKVILGATLNHRTAAADIVWIDAVQFAAKSYEARRAADDATRFADTITELDPYFLKVYTWQSGARIAIAGDPNAEDIRAVNDILEKGMRYFPDRWQLPFEAAVNYIGYTRDTDRKTRIQQLERAASFAESAATTPDTPDLAAILAAGFRKKLARMESGAGENEPKDVALTEDEKELLVRLYLTQDSHSVRAYVERRIQGTDQEELLKKQLRRYVDQFQRSRNRSPLRYLPTPLMSQMTMLGEEASP